jgi:hypothetical protein
MSDAGPSGEHRDGHEAYDPHARLEQLLAGECMHPPPVSPVSASTCGLHLLRVAHPEDTKGRSFVGSAAWILG